MGESLAKYAETSVIKTVQELYAAEMDLSTNVFDAEGRVNIVQPSNLVPLCAEVLRGCPEGMNACKESDRQGCMLLCWAISDPVRNEPRPATPAIRGISNKDDIRMVLPAFSTGNDWHPPIAVVYACKVGFVDFAVPIFDPAETGSRKLLSVAYGGQYVKGD